MHASLHQSISISATLKGKSARIDVALDIVPDDENPYAMLGATGDGGEQLAQVRVLPSFKLNRARAVAWAEGGFCKPAEG